MLVNFLMQKVTHIFLLSSPSLVKSGLTIPTYYLKCSRGRLSKKWKEWVMYICITLTKKNMGGQCLKDTQLTNIYHSFSWTTYFQLEKHRVGLSNYLAFKNCRKTYLLCPFFADLSSVLQKLFSPDPSTDWDNIHQFATTPQDPRVIKHTTTWLHTHKHVKSENHTQWNCSTLVMKIIIVKKLQVGIWRMM